MKELLSNKELKVILISAILIRLLIMPFFFHPDIKVYSFQSSFLSKGVWDIYSYIDQQNENLPYKENFVYFPLTYYFLGIYQILASPFLGSDFQKWLFDASSENISQIGVFRYLFILKLPYLILDILTGFLLMRLFSEWEDKKRVFKLWLLNPFSIYLIYLFSNVDILAVFFTVLCLVFAKKEKWVLAALCLGLGAGFKAYPLIFLPLLVLQAKSLKQKILILSISLGIFLTIILPNLSSKAFIDAALVSGLTTRLFIPSIGLGFGEMIIVPIFVLSIYLGIYLLKKEKSFSDLVIGFIAFGLTIFSFIHFHIQWLIWVMPFITISLVRSRNLVIFFLIGILGLLIPSLYNDKYMTFSLINPVSTSFSLLPSLFVVVRKIYDPLVLQSIIHSTFAGLCFVAVWKLFKDYET